MESIESDKMVLLRRLDRCLDRIPRSVINGPSQAVTEFHRWVSVALAIKKKGKKATAIEIASAIRRYEAYDREGWMPPS